MRGLIDNSVNLGGAQTITGQKKFMQTKIDVDNIPTDTVVLGEGLTFVDKNGVKIGKIEPQYRANGYIELVASSEINGVKTSVSSRAKADGTKDVYISGNSSDNNTALTTTSHKYTDVNNIKFGNGLLIQWGKTDTPNTVTFSTPYSQIPTVLITQNRSSANERNCMVNTITTTSFKTLRYGSESAGNGLEWFSIGI